MLGFELSLPLFESISWTLYDSDTGSDTDSEASIAIPANKVGICFINFAKCQSNAELLKPQEESRFISSHDIT